MGTRGRVAVVVAIGLFWLVEADPSSASLMKADADTDVIPQGNARGVGAVIDDKADLEELVRNNQRRRSESDEAKRPPDRGGEWEMRGGSREKDHVPSAPVLSRVYSIRDVGTNDPSFGGQIFIRNTSEVRDTSGSPSFSIPVDSELVTTVYVHGELVGWFVKPSDEHK